MMLFNYISSSFGNSLDISNICRIIPIFLSFNSCVICLAIDAASHIGNLFISSINTVFRHRRTIFDSQASIIQRDIAIIDIDSILRNSCCVTSFSIIREGKICAGQI